MQIQNVPIHELTTLLIHTHKTVVTAESCTGGMLAAYLTDLPGSSQWFERGFVTYSNAAKIELLNVPPQLLTQFGAVSCEVAHAMASGALAASHADLSIAITGIAGPDGGTLEKPVGTVCFGWGFQGKITTRRMQFPSSERGEIRRLACYEAMKGAIELWSNQKM
jgi:nicotinamide-nucleotide amidase